MKKENEFSFNINFYLVYLVGFFLIIAQIINVIPPWFTPTDWGKAIIFRIILAILVFLFLFQILFRKIDASGIKEKIRSVSLPFWLLVSLFGVYLLATIFSLDSRFSLWGDPFRNGGFVNFAFYILFAILTFLIIRKKDWQKIWDFAIIIGIIVSVIAVLQQFGPPSKYLIPFSFRPVSTLGNAILLSLYLLLLTFISMSFGIRTKGWPKKSFYLFSCLLFLLVSVFLVQTRGAFLGLAIGFLWFLFAYPKKLNKLKIYLGIFLILSVFAMYGLKVYMDSHLYVYQKIPPTISSALDRALSIFEGEKVAESRFSTWKVSLDALKERPILGYGPENFMIAFDKHYNPSLPRISAQPSGEEISEWWDRGHNFVFDISVTAGIPALIIYLLLFGILIWQLQKIKKKSPENAVISTGLQATFLGYLVALFFGFDSVPTYLISFLLIGYSLHLISNNSSLRTESEPTHNKNLKSISNRLYNFRIPVISALFFILVWFTWVCNLKPLRLNKEVNVATAYSEIKKCDIALGMVNKISPQVDDNIINSYLKQEMTGVIYACIKEKQTKDESLIKQEIQLMKEVANNHPNYFQNWFFLGEYINSLIEEKNKLTENVFVSTPEMEQWKNEANNSFEKAHSLSPKRQIVLKEWAKTDIITGDYETAKKRLQECIGLNPNYNLCHWIMALADGYSEDWEGFNHFFNLAKEKGVNTDAEESLKQLVDMYIQVEKYDSLPELYLKLIKITDDKQEKAQLYASLAATYVELGQIENARNTALKMLELIPFLPENDQAQGRADVEAFIQSLGR